MVKQYFEGGKAAWKFLKALRNLVKNKDIKTPQQAYDFAKLQFGEVSKLLRKQIDDIFKKKDVAKPTKKGDVVPIKEEGIVATDKARDIVKKRTKDIAKGDPTGEVDEIMEGLASLKNIKQGGKGLDPREGIVRTAAREILN